MDLTGFETYIAYSLRGAKAQADNETTTLVVQSQTEEKKSKEPEQDV